MSKNKSGEIPLYLGIYANSTLFGNLFQFHFMWEAPPAKPQRGTTGAGGILPHSTK